LKDKNSLASQLPHLYNKTSIYEEEKHLKVSFGGRNQNVIKFVLFTINKQLLPELISALCFTAPEGSEGFTSS